MKTFRNLYINLNGYDIDSFIGQLTEYCLNCAGSWKRNFEREENARYFNEKAFAFEYIGAEGIVSAGVTLFQNDAGLWYVPNIIPIASNQLSIDEYNKLLLDFKESLVDPVRKNTPIIDVKLTPEQVSLKDIVGEEAVEALQRFSASANKFTGNAHPNDKKRWFEFLSAAQKYHTVLHDDILKATLIEQGWSEEWADKLAFEFEYGCDLLDFVGA
ncbi:hypothetical protein [Methylovulum psychrotolerans]|uniref:Uncharacterized protein n=1 Tax=Methylovulum psychrotolerans TaxID=1704499 RepID=A0A2S5CL77_9GAMM|nr:hypothetical protein [Methylovulum psychrotolerans]POZ51569.1 hypothetical protein AADEFJLK_02436 [Methylovulum psychrotolerans]